MKLEEIKSVRRPKSYEVSTLFRDAVLDLKDDNALSVSSLVSQACDTNLVVETTGFDTLALYDLRCYHCGTHLQTIGQVLSSRVFKEEGLSMNLGTLACAECTNEIAASENGE
jgi:hypothetical protein